MNEQLGHTEPELIDKARQMAEGLIALQQQIPLKEDDQVDPRIINIFIADESAEDGSLLPRDLQEMVRTRIATSRAWFREYIAAKLSLTGSTNPDEKLSVAEAAVELGISISLVYLLCEDKSLAHYRVGGKDTRGKYLISRKDIKAFLYSRRVEAEGDVKNGNHAESK
jgi:excisionase family DNA binding protein